MVDRPSLGYRLAGWACLACLLGAALLGVAVAVSEVAR